MLLYVDDILLVSRNLARVAEIKKGLTASFDLKDMGLAKYCLGIEIEQNKNSISLCQSGFINGILARFNMFDCKSVSTPLATGLKLRPCEDLTPKLFPYRELIGALMYLSVGTRPEITHAVSYLSQFNSCHDNTHWTAAKHVLHYLKGTSNMKLVYSMDKKGLRGFADANWGSDITDRKSYSGYVFSLCNGAISWCSKKQKSVALSFSEAEYMSLSDAAKEAIFLSSLLKELACYQPSYHARSKHIDIRAHFIREALKDGKFTLEYMPTEEMIADILTKALPKPKVNFCVNGLGLSREE
ncbi:hypothetical protein TKK_0010268 [Trichogramma kaykai]